MSRLQTLLRTLRRSTAPSAPEPASAAPSAVSIPPARRQRNMVDSEAIAAKISAVIATRMSDPEFGVNDLAVALSTSRATLYRLTAAATGLPPARLILEARLREAARLLAAGKGSVADIAYACGFSGAGYFARCYRLHFGETPSRTLARHCR